MSYVDGANNDVIGVYLDGQLIGETTTFENYHDALGGDHIGNAQANLTDRVIFRESNGETGQPEDSSRQDLATTQGFNFDNLTVSDYNNTSGTGNNLANVITGNSGDNVLTGLGGNDTINGGIGIDTALVSPRTLRGRTTTVYGDEQQPRPCHRLQRGYGDRSERGA